MKPLFKIIFLCEDSSAQGRAETLKNTLVKNCSDEVHIDAHFCEYARLCHPRLRQTALTHAVEADMIIISAQGTNAIPAFVQDWMNEVGPLRPEKIICAEFLEKTDSESALTFHRFIEKWAAQNSEILFSNLFLPSKRPAFSFTSFNEGAAVATQNRMEML